MIADWWDLGLLFNQQSLFNNHRSLMPLPHWTLQVISRLVVQGDIEPRDLLLLPDPKTDGRVDDFEQDE